MTTKETEQLLHTIADPDHTLPKLELALDSHANTLTTYGAYAHGEHIGHITLEDENGTYPFAVRHSLIDERERRKGHGLALYLGAAALAYEAGHLLRSDPYLGVSQFAAKEWIALQRRGLARMPEKFFWRAGSEQSNRGYAEFRPIEQLESLVPQRTRHPAGDDVWQDVA